MARVGVLVRLHFVLPSQIGHQMTQLRATEIASELIELFNQQSGALDGNVGLKDWTQAQVDEYEHRRDRIRRLTEELTHLPF
jgi:hypothetical protein